METNVEIPFFDHIDICVLLYGGNVGGAKDLFVEKMARMESIMEIRQIYDYVASLNWGIYYYILAKENVALKKCCQDNQHSLEKKLITFQNLLGQGLATIHAYGYCKDYIIERHQNPYIRSALSFIRDHFSENIHVQDIARSIGLSKNYFLHLFKAETGHCVMEYITKSRVDLSCQLLLSTDISITMISGICGFNSASYFSTVFRKEQGESPVNYRKKADKKARGPFDFL